MAESAGNVKMQPVESQSPGVTSLIAPGAATALGMSSLPDIYDRSVGRRTLYHGTTRDAANKIRVEGLQPSMGGTGASVVDPDYVLHSKGHIHVSPHYTAARPFTHFAQPAYRDKFLNADKWRRSAVLKELLNLIFKVHPEGEVLKAHVPEVEFLNKFRVDPDFTVGGFRSTEPLKAERIVGPKYKGVSLKELASNFPEYVSRSKGRFASGILGAGLTAASTAWFVKRLKDLYDANTSKVPAVLSKASAENAKMQSTLPFFTAHENTPSSSPLYRYTADGTGVWQRAKERVTKEEWEDILRKSTWLLKPTDYPKGGTSYFTEEGRKQYLEHGSPLLSKHLPNIKEEVFDALPPGLEEHYSDALQVVGKPTSTEKAAADYAMPFFTAQHLTNREPDFYQIGDEFLRGMDDSVRTSMDDPNFKRISKARGALNPSLWNEHKDVPFGLKFSSKGLRVLLQVPGSKLDVAGRSSPVVGVFEVPKGDPGFARNSVAKLQEFADRTGHGMTPETAALAEKLLHSHWKKQQGLLGIVRRHKLLTGLAALGIPVASYVGYKLLKKEGADSDFALGLPDPKRFGNVQDIPRGKLLQYVVQRHLAARSGSHLDVRFGEQGPKSDLFSWATKKELPKPGEKRMLYQQALHSGQYASFEGEISSGYGKGTVTTHDKGTIVVTKAEPDKIQFVMAHKKFPEYFTMIRQSGPPADPKTNRQRRTQGGSWLMINTTPVSAAKFLKGTPEETGLSKLKYTKVPAADVEKLFNKDYMVQEKLDGASALFHLLGDRIEAVSYRTNKAGRPIIHTFRTFGPGGAKVTKKVPPELVGTILRGEITGEREGKSIPPQELGGILNATVENALEKQREGKIKMRNTLFDVVREGKTPIAPKSLTAQERMDKLKSFMQYLPKESFRLPETAATPEEARALYERITTDKHPLTNEGIVAWPSAAGSVPVKVKLRPERDVWVKNIFPGEGKYEGVGAGGFEYSLSPEGDVVGRVGTGLSDQTRQEMLSDPDSWLGRMAKITAQDQFPSGAFKAPSFISLHEDYSPVPDKVASALRTRLRSMTKLIKESGLDRLSLVKSL